MFDAVVNYWAVLVAALASIVVGSVWYSSGVFGKSWAEISKVDMSDMSNPSAKNGMIVMAISTLVTAYVLVQVLSFTAAFSIAEGATVAFWLWLGFVATVMLTRNTFAQQPTKLFYIDAFYQLVSLVVMASILVSWQ